MVTDECTAKKLRVSYARVLIEVDITRSLPECVPISEHTGKKILQPVVYEWKPDYCATCMKVGHDCAKQKQVQKRVVRPGPRNGQGGRQTTGVWRVRPEGTGAIGVGQQGQVMAPPAAISGILPNADMGGAREIGMIGSRVGTSQTGTSSSEPPWIEVRPSASPSVLIGQVHCQNGFSPLGIVNDPGGGTEKVP